jgi:hypothetical protein
VPRTTHAAGTAIHLPFDTGASRGDSDMGSVSGKASLVSRGHDCLAQRMFDGSLQRRSDPQDLVTANSIGTANLDDSRSTLGQGACLIKGNAAQFARRFEEFTALDQQPQPRRLVETAEYRDRN